MSHHTHTAKKAFEESLAHIDRNKNPEQWNLFTGLLCITKALDELDDDVRKIKNKVGA